MARNRLSYLLDLDKLLQVLSDIEQITLLPTSIMSIDNMVMYHGKNNQCQDFSNACNQCFLIAAEKMKSEENFTLFSCPKAQNNVIVPIKIDKETIALLIQCNFLSNAILTDKHTIQKKNTSEHTIQLLIHFAELISAIGVARLKEQEVNTKLDLMIQRETVELLKTNEELENEINERKLAEIKLRNSEERFRSIFEQTSIGIMTLSTSYRLLNCNLAINQMLGFSIQQLRSKRLKNLIYKDDFTALEEKLNLLVDRKINNFYLECRFTNNQKKILWGRITVSLISYHLLDSPDFIVMMMEDITSRKNAENELTESEERFRGLFENAPEPVYLYDPKTLKIILANKFTEKFFGYTQNELKITPLTSLVLSSSESIKKKSERILRKGEPVVEEQKYIRKNGDLVDVDVISVKNFYHGKNCILSFVRDITARKHYEAEITKSLEKERELSQLKSNFVSTVSHEFRTPMAVILSSVQLLEKFNTKWDEEKKQKLYQKIYKSVLQTNNLINNVLLNSKDQSGKLEFRPTKLHFEEFCQQIIEETLIIFGAEIKILSQFKTSFGKIFLDPNLLRHIITNLLSNAIKYSDTSKDILFKTTAIKKDLLCISVQDFGIGIDAEDLKKIYEPFFRAKNAGQIQGTGLGMSIVKRCVDLHNGSIEIISEPGIGTLVNVMLKAKYNLKT